MKAGIWGLGSIGMRHARNASALGLEVMGFDPDSERQELFKKEIGAVVSSEQDLLTQSDIIVICSPNDLHASHLSQAIENNCHVLIEKPIAHKIEGLKEVLEQAKSKNLLIAPAMNMRFDDVVRKSKEIIDSGKYNKPLWARFVCSSYLPDWRPHQDHRKGYANDPKTGGVIFDIIHEFDIAYFVMGKAKVQSCLAVNSQSIGLEAEDCADISLLTEEGAVPVTIHLDYISRYGQRYFEIQFENNYMRADLNGRIIRVVNNDGSIAQEEEISQPDTECYIDEMKAFINAIKGTESYLCSAEESLDVLSNVIAARKLAGLPA